MVTLIFLIKPYYSSWHLLVQGQQLKKTLEQYVSSVGQS